MGHGFGEAEVRAFIVIPIEPAEQLEVECGQIGEQQIGVIARELLSQGAVKAFAMGIHFWGFRIGVPMGHGVALELLGKVAFELAAVVGQDSLDATGEDRKSVV